MGCIDKERIYRAVQQGLQQLKERKFGGCLYTTHFAAQELYQQERVVIQAGSLMWPRIKPEEDDGVCNTHFSYMWENDPANCARCLALGILPEIHVWLALPNKHELIDFSTGELQAQCALTTNMKWTAPPPPRFFWGGVDALPEGVVYQPSMDACLFVLKLMWKIFDQPEYLRQLFKERK